MSETIVKTIDLCKKYNNYQAVNHVNMDIKKGQIYGFIGKNGAGKTTTIRLLTGLAKPTSGEVELFGKTGKRELQKQRRNIGCIIEAPALYPDMTAYENMKVQSIQRGVTKDGCVEDALEVVNLSYTQNKKAKNFSLGMRQRLGLAIALLGDPGFLILDEPTNGLDPMGIVEMRETIMKINKERDITILISSHILSELHLIATDYGIIHKGSLIQQITAEELDEKCKKYLKLGVDDLDRTIDLLENSLNIHDIEQLPDNTLKINAEVERLEDISNTLLGSGIGLWNFSLEGDDLETYFTRLIGGMNA